MAQDEPTPVIDVPTSVTTAPEAAVAGEPADGETAPDPDAAPDAVVDAAPDEPRSDAGRLRDGRAASCGPGGVAVLADAPA